MDKAEIKYTRDDNVITIAPLFDPENPELCPDKLKYKTLLEELTKEPWTRSNKQLAAMSADFGRSHYFFTNKGDEIPQAVHKYCFTAEGELPDDERQSFLEKLGIKGDTLVADLSSPSPARSAIVTRVKYEMLKGFLIESGIPKIRASKVALQAMYMSTQEFLGWIKYSALQVLFP